MMFDEPWVWPCQDCDHPINEHDRECAHLDCLCPSLSMEEASNEQIQQWMIAFQDYYHYNRGTASAKEAKKAYYSLYAVLIARDASAVAKSTQRQRGPLSNV